jgi:hypothetical protein
VTPQISVIIPTYNRADMLGDAIASVLAQTYADWELIVVDDGSIDDTEAVVARYSDPRIRYIYQENRKLPGARNTGIRASTGEYVAFLDSDDLFLPEKLSVQAAAMENRPDIGLVASGWHEVDLQRKVLRRLRPWQARPDLDLSGWLNGCPFIVPSVLVRRTWLIQVGLFDEDQHYVEDWDLWLRLAYAGCQMAWEPAVVCLRTIHEGNMVHNAARMSAGLQRVFDKFFAQADLPESIRQQAAHVYANVHLNAAVRFLGAGDIDTGAQHLEEAITLNPGLLAGTPPRVVQSLASASLTHQVREREHYIADVCRILPQLSRPLVWSSRQMRATIAATQAFEAHGDGDGQQARRYAWRALAIDPMWLRNRGFVKIALAG